MIDCAIENDSQQTLKRRLKPGRQQSVATALILPAGHPYDFAGNRDGRKISQCG